MTNKRVTAADYKKLQADLLAVRKENGALNSELQLLRRRVESAEYVAHWLSHRLGEPHPNQEQLWLHMREAHRLMMEARWMTIEPAQKNAVAVVLFAIDDLAATIPLTVADMIKGDNT